MHNKVRIKPNAMKVYREEHPEQFKGQRLIPKAAKDWLESMKSIEGRRCDYSAARPDGSFDIITREGLIGVPKAYIDREHTLIEALNELEKDIFFGKVDQYHNDKIRELVIAFGYSPAEY